MRLHLRPDILIPKWLNFSPSRSVGLAEQSPSDWLLLIPRLRILVVLFQRADVNNVKGFE
jgi:hypothetical protein